MLGSIFTHANKDPLALEINIRDSELVRERHTLGLLGVWLCFLISAVADFVASFRGGKEC